MWLAIANQSAKYIAAASWLAVANQCNYIQGKFACQEDGGILLIEKMALVGRLCYNKQNARFLEVPMAIHESGQMYLETIYILSQNSTFVRAIDVGAQLGFTKPSVSRAMSILKKDGYVNVDADGAITLTEAGLAIAKTMYTRHTVLSQMLMELGVDEETATEDACRIEHVISEKSFAAVQAHLEQVTKMWEDAHWQ